MVSQLMPAFALGLAARNRFGAVAAAALVSLAGTLPADTDTAAVAAAALPAERFAAAVRAGDAPRLVLRTGIYDPVFEHLSVPDLALAEPPPAYGIVQFQAGTGDTARRLREAGITPLASIPEHAWLVRWSARARQRAQQLREVRWAGDFRAAMKLAPALLQRDLLARRAVRLADGQLSAPGITLEILGFPGTDPKALAAAAIKLNPEARAAGFGTAARRPTAVVWIPAATLGDTLEALTGVASVYQIDAAVPVEPLNTDSVEPIQANAVSGNPLPTLTPLWDQGLTGSGQIVAVMDSGLDRNEDWFVGLDTGGGVNVALTDAAAPVPPLAGPVFPANKVYAYWVQPGATAFDNNAQCTPTSAPTGHHGTHVVGTVAGDSLTRSAPTDAGYDDGDGMAPNAQLLFQDIGNDDSGCLSITDLGASLTQAANGGAAIHSNSWGAGVNGVYNANSAALDDATWALESLLVTVSAGNSGPGTDTIGAPATAKNALTVGALLHGNSTGVVNFSSRGPTDDGRIKPDIQAPGTSIRSARGDDNNAPSVEPAEISSKSGTSMSNPTVAGGAALARQYFADGFYPGGTPDAADADAPSGALLKAVLLNGTRADAAFAVPGNDYGWGRIWLDNNLFFSGDSRYLRRWDFSHATGLATGQTHAFDVDVAAGQELRATLVWFDVAGAVGSGVTLVNDLDLQLTAPGGQVFRGNVFDGASQSLPGGDFDRLNTVEQVLLPAPSAGTYTLEVTGHAVPGNGQPFSDRQGYALVLSAATPPDPALGAPANVTATDQADAGIAIEFDALAGAAGYNIYRANGDCTAGEVDFSLVGHTTSPGFVDDLAIGGFTYSYRVRAEDGAREGPASTCGSASVATSTGACDLRPEFDQSSVTASDATGDLCGIDLDWAAGQARCPLGAPLRYNVYRSTDPFFNAGPGNLLAGDVEGTGFTDASALPETTYFYIVRAEDGTDPVAGNESLGNRQVQAASFGDGSVPGTFSDAVDGLALMQPDTVWAISDNHAAGGALSYRSAGDEAATYSSNTCATLTSPEIDLQAGDPVLSFQARFDLEADWDGIVVEISTDDGASWTPLTPDGGYPGSFSATGDPPVNACGYPASQGAFNGSTNGAFAPFDVDLGGFSGQTVRLRWVLSSDPAVEEEGLYLDNIEVTAASMPAACVLGEGLFADGFESP